MSIIAWSKGKGLHTNHPEIEKNFKVLFPELVDELDYRVYVHVCNLFLRHALACVLKGTETNFEVLKLRMKGIAKHLLPMFHGWRTILTDRKKQIRKPSEDSFTALLEKQGLITSVDALLRAVICSD